MDFEAQPTDGILPVNFSFCGVSCQTSFVVGPSPDVGVVVIGQKLMDYITLSVDYDSRRNRVCRMGDDRRIVPSFHKKGQ